MMTDRERRKAHNPNRGLPMPPPWLHLDLRGSGITRTTVAGSGAYTDLWRGNGLLDDATRERPHAAAVAALRLGRGGTAGAVVAGRVRGQSRRGLREVA